MVEDVSPSIVDENGRSRVNQLRSILTKFHLSGVARFIDRSARRLIFAGINLLRSLARVPLIGPGLDPLLVGIDRRGRFQFELTELLRVCRALSNEGLVYWVAGGWGLDALVGSETRRHGDLDLVLDSFEESLPKVAALLTGLGYRRKKPLGGILWFPDAEVYEDNRGHHIEVLNINWELLTLAQALLSPPPIPEPESTSELRQMTPSLLQLCAATGVLDGVRLPVLSAAAQQLFHYGFQLRQEDSHDDDIIRLISTEQVAWSESSDQAAVRPSKQESRETLTLLLVPIFTFPPDLMRLCRLHHNDLDLLPPHVTLAFSFLPLESVTAEVVQQLSTLFDEVLAFDFELSQVRWFGTNVVYLEPSNGDSFRSITETLQRKFPEFHPYDDAFDSVIPHVTLSEHGRLADRRVLGRHAPKYLPITARASHVWMMSNEEQPDKWSIVKIFPLGSALPAPPSDHPA
jgi:2'-5' RNA ligase